MARRYCECGRKVVVRRSKNRGGVKQGKDDHELCQKCWKAERDKEVSQVRRVTSR